MAVREKHIFTDMEADRDEGAAECSLKQGQERLTGTVPAPVSQFLRIYGQRRKEGNCLVQAPLFILKVRFFYDGFDKVFFSGRDCRLEVSLMVAWIYSRS